MTYDIEYRYALLNAALYEGRVIRGAWRAGQERACLLATLAPECGEAKDTDACPAELMPPWLAELVPNINDNGSAAAWPAMTMRFARLIRAVPAIHPDRLDAVRAEWLYECVVPLAVTGAWAACWMGAPPSVAELAANGARSAVASAATTQAAWAAQSAARVASCGTWGTWATSQASAWDFMTADLFTRIEREAGR